MHLNKMKNKNERAKKENKHSVFSLSLSPSLHSPCLVDKKISPRSLHRNSLFLSLGHGGRSNSIHQNTVLHFFFIIAFSLKPNTPPPTQPQLCLTPLLKFLVPPPSQSPHLQIPQ